MTTIRIFLEIILALKKYNDGLKRTTNVLVVRIIYLCEQYF